MGLFSTVNDIGLVSNLELDTALLHLPRLCSFISFCRCVEVFLLIYSGSVEAVLHSAGVNGDCVLALLATD